MINFKTLIDPCRAINAVIAIRQTMCPRDPNGSTSLTSPW